jgi:beta-phosphoglucomutase-like phosphatase (HAD superfamily)
MTPTALILFVLSFIFSVGAFSLGSPKNGGLSIRQSFDAIIWDCDGVLVDSEALLKKGEVDALKLLGYDLSVADCTRLFSGVSPDMAMENFKAEFNQDLPPTFFKEQIDCSMDLFRRELQPLMFDTVKKLSEADIPQYVASGSPRDRVLLSIEVGGMGSFLKPDVVFTRELVAKGKPAPDLFLYTAEKAQVDPKRCLVVEDSVSGIEAALAADMHCISFLGGGHTNGPGYRDKIFSYDVHHTYTQEEVLMYVTQS